MTKDEFSYWQSVIENSRFKWTEDAIFRLNGRGSFYYTGGENGVYMKISKDGLLEAGTYEGAIPHIGDAMFKPAATRQCADYSEAFAVTMEAGGIKFLADMFSADTPALPPQAEKTLDEQLAEEGRQWFSEPEPILTARIYDRGQNVEDDEEIKTVWCAFPNSSEYITGKLDEIGIDGKRHFDYSIIEYESPVEGLTSHLPEYANLGELNYLAALVAEMNEGNREFFGALMESGHYCDDVGDMIFAAKNIKAFDVRAFYSLEEFSAHFVETDNDVFAETFQWLDKLAQSDPIVDDFVDYVRRLEKYYDATAFAKDLVKQENGMFIKDYGYVTETDEFNYKLSREIPPEYRMIYPSQEHTPEERPSALGRLAAAKDAVARAEKGKPGAAKEKSRDTEL